MTQDELIELLNAHEWRDVEFKEARRAVPKNAYETVSAFANTEGGHLVFGVKKSGQDMEVVGVLDVDKVQNEFLTTLRQPDKISVVVNVREELHKYDGSDLLIFYVPEVHRSHKPVFLNRDIRRSFVRSGGSDIRCSDNERNRFLMDAATERYDGQSVDLDLSTALDLGSIKWYRGIYEGQSRGTDPMQSYPTRISSTKWACLLNSPARYIHRAQRFFYLAPMRPSDNSCRVL